MVIVNQVLPDITGHHAHLPVHEVRQASTAGRILVDDNDPGKLDMGPRKRHIFGALRGFRRGTEHIDLPALGLFEDLIPAFQAHKGEFDAQFLFDQRGIIGRDAPVVPVRIKEFNGWKIRVRCQADDRVPGKPCLLRRG